MRFRGIEWHAYDRRQRVTVRYRFIIIEGIFHKRSDEGCNTSVVECDVSLGKYNTITICKALGMDMLYDCMLTMSAALEPSVKHLDS